MNALYEHHMDSIRFGIGVLTGILLNELIQPFQQPERVVGFFNTYRHLYPAPTWCSPRGIVNLTKSR